MHLIFPTEFADDAAVAASDVVAVVDDGDDPRVDDLRPVSACLASLQFFLKLGTNLVVRQTLTGFCMTTLTALKIFFNPLFLSLGNG